MNSVAVDEDKLDSSTDDNLGPMSRLSNVALRDRAYSEIANALRAGKFAPASMVTIRGLAEMLGTSTMPVREAVSRLVTERALEMLPNRTLRVPTISLPMLDELFDVRVTVEGRAAALAAQRMSNADFTRIKLANESYGHALDDGDLAAAVEANEQLHFAIYRASGSTLLLSIIETLWLQSGPYLASVLRKRHTAADSLHERGVMHHFDILAALAKRDPDAACKAVQADIADAGAWYKGQIFTEGEVVSAPKPARRRKKE
jgi:DNA-binding GntR family transcriptional regulator